MTRRAAIFFALLALGAARAAEPRPPPAAEARTVALDFYYEPGCRECEQVWNELLPALAAAYAGRYRWTEYDLGVKSNYLRLVSRLDQLARTDNEHVYLQVDGRRLLAGYSVMTAELFGALEEALAEVPPAAAPEPPAPDLAARARRFTPLGVALAGLLDGINPCAIATLVFFVSLLATARVRGRRLLLAGAIFCAASFVTYFAIGCGLLRTLHLLAGFTILRTTVDRLMAALLLLAGLLSLRDAWRFAVRRDPAAVALQLPAVLKARIRRVMRSELRNRHLVVAAATIGMTVTAIESVCTGQVYVPTLVVVLRAGASVTRNGLLLLLYNLAFILPLATVFTLVYLGLAFSRLLAWSARHVILGKLLLGLFFLALAALILA